MVADCQNTEEKWLNLVDLRPPHKMSHVQLRVSEQEFSTIFFL
jgi:hypothetical protein